MDDRTAVAAGEKIDNGDESLNEEDRQPSAKGRGHDQDVDEVSHVTSFDDESGWHDENDGKMVSHCFRNTEVSDESQIFNGDAGNHSIMMSRRHDFIGGKISRSSFVNGNIGLEEYLIATGNRKRTK